MERNKIMSSKVPTLAHPCLYYIVNSAPTDTFGDEEM